METASIYNPTCPLPVVCVYECVCVRVYKTAIDTVALLLERTHARGRMAFQCNAREWAVKSEVPTGWAGSECHVQCL